jgi:tetratricopeptide (TPR) repeat protein
VRRALILAGVLAVGLAGLVATPSDVAARKRKSAQGGGGSADDANLTEAHKHYSFGYTFFQQGLLNKAKESLEQSLKWQPDYPEALYVLGMVNLELNDYQEAIALFQRCLDSNPYFTEAHNLLGLTYAKMGDHQAALRQFDAVKADINFPTPEVAHYNIGKVFSETENCGEAVLHFRRALEINASFGKAWFMLGDCQEQLGQVELARSSLEKAVEHLEGDPSAHYRLGYVCFLLKDFACARQNFDFVRVNYPSSPLSEGAREFIRQIDFR